VDVSSVKFGCKAVTARNYTEVRGRARIGEMVAGTGACAGGVGKGVLIFLNNSAMQN
jgi:hypothetical protein